MSELKELYEALNVLNGQDILVVVDGCISCQIPRYCFKWHEEDNNIVLSSDSEQEEEIIQPFYINQQYIESIEITNFINQDILIHTTNGLTINIV
jgi:hypothetical protein